MKSAERERERDEDDDDDEICEVINGTKKVNSECLFVVFTFQELEVPLTWFCYVVVLCRILSFST